MTKIIYDNIVGKSPKFFLKVIILKIKALYVINFLNHIMRAVEKLFKSVN